MHKRVRYRRIRLYPYDLTNRPLWSLPLASPSPTPIAPIFYKHRLPYRKIALVALMPLSKVPSSILKE